MPKSVHKGSPFMIGAKGTDSAQTVAKLSGLWYNMFQINSKSISNNNQHKYVKVILIQKFQKNKKTKQFKTIHEFWKQVAWVAKIYLR